MQPSTHRRTPCRSPRKQIEALKKITSPSVANAIETFKVRPREQGNVSSAIRPSSPRWAPWSATPVTCVIRAEAGPIDGHRASTYGWWDYVQTIPAPRVIVVHDLDEPRGQGAQWGEVQANIHRALGCVGVVTDGSVRDLDEVRALKFQFCAAHVSVSHANVHMVDFGIPVKVGGVWIKPGDLVHGDQHGVVHHPARDRPADPGGHRQGRGRREEDHQDLPEPRLHRRQAQGALQADPGPARTEALRLSGRPGPLTMRRGAHDRDSTPRVADSVGCTSLAAQVIGRGARPHPSSAHTWSGTT